MIVVSPSAMLTLGSEAHRADRALQKLIDLTHAVSRMRRGGPGGAARGAPLPRRPILPSMYAEAVPPEPWHSNTGSDDERSRRPA